MTAIARQRTDALLLLSLLPALALFAAHALRRGDFGSCAALLLCMPLLFRRSAWMRYVLILLFAWAALQWAATGMDLVRVRFALEEPWLRLGVIITAVWSVNLLALSSLFFPSAGRWFYRYPAAAPAQTAAFLLTASLLLLTRHAAPLPVLLMDRFDPHWTVLEMFLIALYAAWLIGKVRDPALHARLRPLFWLIFSLLFFAQLALGLIGVSELLMTGVLHLPVPALIIGGPLYRGHGLFMPILFATTLLLVGPAWCSHLCYIGAWDDRLARQSTRIRPPRKWIVRGRLLTLVLTVACALGLRAAEVPPLHAAVLALCFGLGGIGVMFLFSRRSGAMVHCTTWCPIGLVANVLGRISPWRMRIRSGCTACGSCARVCRYGALRERNIAAGRPGLSCTLCGECVSACPHQVMDYALPGVHGSAARTVFLIIVVTLHALFLAVARI